MIQYGEYTLIRLALKALILALVPSSCTVHENCFEMIIAHSSVNSDLAETSVVCLATE